MSNEIVPPFFSATHVTFPLVMAHRRLTWQEALLIKERVLRVIAEDLAHFL